MPERKKYPRKPALRGPAERNALAEANVRLVHHVLARLARAIPRRDYDDAFQDGAIALLRAAELYDGRGKFSTFAYHYVRGQVLVGRKARERSVIAVPARFCGEERAAIADRLRTLPLDAPGEARGTDSHSLFPRERTLAAQLADHREPPPSERFDAEEALRRCGVHGRDAEVVRLRLRGLTLRQVGARLGLSCERVRQIQLRVRRLVREAGLWGGE